MVRSPFNFPNILEDLANEVGISLSKGFEDTGLDLSEDKKNIYVKAALPGLKEDEIDVSLENGMLHIKGEKKEEEKDKERKYYRQSQSSFWYRVTLPPQADETQKLEANYNNGFVEITIPKSPIGQKKTIPIKAAKK
jgi:HSP20 family protein